MRTVASALLVAALALVPTRSAHAGQTIREQVLEDHDFGFVLRVPRGWRLHGEDELGPDAEGARAAVFDPRTSLVGRVYVDADPRSLEEVASERAARARGLGLSVAEPRSRDHGAIAGLFLDSTAEVDGKRAAYGEWLLRRGADLVLLGAARTGEDTAATEEAFRTFFASFDLAPESGAGRPRLRSAADAEAVTWTVRDGVFTSAIGGYRFAPGDGWMVVGEEEGEARPDVWATTLSGPRRQVLISSFAVSPAERASAEARLREKALRSFGPLAEAEGTSISLGGEACRFRRHVPTDGTALEAHHGVVFHGEVGVQAVWVASRGDRDAAARAVAEVLGRFQWLSAEVRDAARQEARARQARDVRFGNGWSFRAGVFRSHHAGIEWRSPSPLSRLAFGAGSRDDRLLWRGDTGDPSALCLAGIDVATDPDVFHARALRETPGEFDRRVDLPTGHPPELVTRVSALKAEGGTRTFVATLSKGWRSLRCLVRVADGPAALSAVDRVLGGFDVPERTPPEREQVGRTWFEHRAGFGLTLPDGPSWTFSAHPATEPRSVVVARDASDWIAAYAVPTSGDIPKARRSAWCETQLPIGGWPRVVRREPPWRLGGREASHHAWGDGLRELHVFLVSESHVCHALSVTAPADASREFLEARVSRFAFLD
jgi:hypothetical protein